MDNNHLSEPTGRKISKLNPVQEDDYSSSVRKKLSGSSRTGQACDRCKVCILLVLLSHPRTTTSFRPVHGLVTLAAIAHHYDKQLRWCDIANGKSPLAQTDAYIQNTPVSA
jgi:hypothetical protein